MNGDFFTMIGIIAFFVGIIIFVLGILLLIICLLKGENEKSKRIALRMIIGGAITVLSGFTLCSATLYILK